MVLISEVVAVEQILIRNLPAGTKAALKARAEQHRRSVEAEAREILADALEREPVTLVDLLGTDEGADIEFEPERLGLTARTPEL
jgi:plasmid stability protein